MINVRNYTTVMSKKLEESECGNFSITKAVISKGTVMRTYTPHGFFYHDRFNRDFPTVKLKEGKESIWMSDTPLEQEALRVPTVLAHGDVLVLGLGIGLFPTLLRMRNKAVDSITIIERERDVIKLVYDKVRFRKTRVIECEAKKYFAEDCWGLEFDFIYIDVWGGIISPIKEIDEWTELAKHCLKEGGEVRCWLQELYDRIKHKLPKEPTEATSEVGFHDPCLICGKKLRNDYAGLCMDCADELEVSELFVRR